MDIDTADSAYSRNEVVTRHAAPCDRSFWRRRGAGLPGFLAMIWGLLLPASSLHGQETCFPFVIPGNDATGSATDFSFLSKGAAGADGFVRIVDGHFATDSGRLRIWGVNLCFAANFPVHSEADKLAAHLAKLGVNGVRIHHHETRFAPAGLLSPDGTFDPQQVDRLDYLCAQLHAHGIYVNLNMHVGRAVSQSLGLPQLGTQHYLMRDKHALHFQPQVQQAYWDFCRGYLDHVNPYRKLRRADDPGIAMIELCNENRFSEAGPAALLKAPEPYRSAILQRWNAWLKQQFGTTARLKAAWAEKGPRTEPRTLFDSQAWTATSQQGWQLSDNRGRSPIELIIRRDGDHRLVRCIPGGKAERAWHQQLSSPQISLDDKFGYVVEFEARSDAARQISLNVATTASGKWESMGLTQRIELKPAWRSFQYRFQPPRSVQHAARLAFDLGGEMPAVEFRNLKWIRGGSAVALPPGQTIEQGNIDLPGLNWTAASRAALLQFMRDTERTFYADTIKLLKRELGVRVPITTTQANYQPIEILDQVADYADMHAYWHHPIFPGKPWDANNWTVQSESLVPFPFSDKWPRVNLLMRGSWRLHNKPFTFSEWNVGEPSFFAADAIPVAAIAASLQDWDAVFFFTYQSAPDRWNTDKIGGFFEFNGQPVKLALVSALAPLFRRVDLPPLADELTVSPDQREQLGPHALHYRISVDPRRATASSAKASGSVPPPPDRLVRSRGGDLVWDARDPRRAMVCVRRPATRLAWGFVANRQIDLGDWHLSIGDSERDYAVVVATSRDGLPLEQSRHILITAVGHAENQQMGWNQDHTSVGTQWGTGPTIVNGIPLDLIVPAAQRATRCFALDGQGRRRAKVPADRVPGGGHRYRLGPSWRTLFYELSTE